MYSGEVNHETITGIFEGAADFIVRRLCCNGVKLYAYAIDGLMAKGLLTENPLRDHVAAVSVGMVDGQPVLDLDYTEDSGCDTDMNVVMTGQGGFVEIQGTAEGVPFSREDMQALLALADEGIRAIVGLQQAARQP